MGHLAIWRNLEKQAQITWEKMVEAKKLGLVDKTCGCQKPSFCIPPFFRTKKLCVILAAKNVGFRKKEEKIHLISAGRFRSIMSRAGEKKTCRRFPGEKRFSRMNFVESF